MLNRYRQNSLTAPLLVKCKRYTFTWDNSFRRTKEAAFHIQDLFPKIMPEENLPSHTEEINVFVVTDLKVTKMTAEVKIYWDLFHFYGNNYNSKMSSTEENGSLRKCNPHHKCPL